METVRLDEKDRDGRDKGISSLFRSKDIPISHISAPNSTRLRSLLPELLLRGAQVSSSLNVDVTHVVVDFENNYSVEKELALQVCFLLLFFTLCICSYYFLTLLESTQ